MGLLESCLKGGRALTLSRLAWTSGVCCFALGVPRGRRAAALVPPLKLTDGEGFVSSSSRGATSLVLASMMQQLLCDLRVCISALSCRSS